MTKFKMADIVNKVLKSLLIALLLDQLVTPVRPHLQPDDALNRAWSDVIEDDAAIYPGYSPQGRHNKRAIRAGTGLYKPPTIDGQKARRTDDLPTKSRLERNADPSIASGQSLIAPVAVTDTGPCDPNPCSNGGTCRRDQTEKGAYQCACPLQYRGKFCHEVMTTCEVIGCRDVTDCISSPSGAICICKGMEAGRLCQLDVANPSEWEKMKMVVSERTVHTGEIAVGCTLAIIALLVIFFAIHCHRVNSRRAVVRKRYKEVLDKGIVPFEPPPDWCDISSDVIKQTIFCKDSSMIDDYKPRKSLSRIQSQSKQAEDELVRLLNSRTSIPVTASRTNDPENRRLSYSLLQDIDEELRKNAEPEVSPEQIDVEINRRASSLRNLELNRPITSNRSLNNRYIPTLQSRIRPFESRASSRRLPKPSTANSRSSIGYRPFQGQSKSNYALQNGLLNRASQQNYKTNRQRSDSSLLRTKTRPDYRRYDQPPRYNEVSDGDEFDQTSEPIYESTPKYYNYNARKSHFYDRSHNAYNNSYNQNEAISYDSSYYREEFKKKMEDTKDNLETLKASISHRNFTRNTKTNLNNEIFPNSKPKGMMERTPMYVTRSMRENLAVGSSSSEEETNNDGTLPIRLNMKRKTLSDGHGAYGHSARNEYFNTNTNYKSNDHDQSEVYYRYVYHYGQLAKSPSQYSYEETSNIDIKNVNYNKNVEDEYRHDLPFFYGNSVDPSILHDNLETTHSYSNREPRNNMMYQENRATQMFEKSKDNLDNEVQEFGSQCTFGKDITHLPYAASYDASVEYGQEPRDKLTESRTLEQSDTQQDMPQSGHSAREAEHCFRQEGSEYYGILTTTVAVSPNEEKSQYIQQGNNNNIISEAKAFHLGTNIKESLDLNYSTEMQFARSFDNNGQKLYFISSELECHVEGSNGQVTLDNHKAGTEVPTRIEQDADTGQYKYALSPRLEGINSPNKFANLENTPSTIVGTANTTVRSTTNLDEVTLVAESNASDTEIEL